MACWERDTEHNTAEDMDWNRDGSEGEHGAAEDRGDMGRRNRDVHRDSRTAERDLDERRMEQMGEDSGAEPSAIPHN